MPSGRDRVDVVGLKAEALLESAAGPSKSSLASLRSPTSVLANRLLPRICGIERELHACILHGLAPRIDVVVHLRGKDLRRRKRLERDRPRIDAVLLPVHPRNTSRSMTRLVEDGNSASNEDVLPPLLDLEAGVGFEWQDQRDAYEEATNPQPHEEIMTVPPKRASLREDTLQQSPGPQARDVRSDPRVRSHG